MGLWDRVKAAAQMLAISGAIAYLGWLNAKPFLRQRAPQAVQQAERVKTEHAALDLVLCDTSPDGKRIVFNGLSAPGNRDVFLFDVERRTLENITQSAANEGYVQWLDNDTVKLARLGEEGYDYYWLHVPTQRSGEAPSRKLVAGLWWGGLVGVPLAALLGLAFIKRKRHASLVSALVEHSSLTASTAFLSTAGTIAAIDYLLFYYPDEAEILRTGYLSLATAMGGLVGICSDMVASVKPPRIRNYLKRTLYNLRLRSGNYESKIAALEKLKPIISHPRTLPLTHAVIALRHGRHEEGYLQFRRGLEALTDELDNPINNLPLGLFALKVELAVRKKSAANTLTKALVQTIQYKFDSAFDELEAFAAEHPTPEHVAVRALYTQALLDAWPAFQRMAPKQACAFEQHLREQHSSLEHRAQGYWKGAVDSILADPGREQQFTLMGESRNEVLEYAAGKFLRGLFVFKRCAANDGMRLQRERRRVLDLCQHYKNHVVQSLAFLEHEGKAYHVLLHGASRTLENVFMIGTPEDRCSALVRATTALARMHLTPEGDVRTIAEGYYAKRLQTVFYDQLAGKTPRVFVPRVAREAGLQIGARVAQELKDAPVGWYKDANPRNWLVEDDGRVVAIDFEHEDQLPVQLDLVSLLEFGPAPVTETECHAALERYLRVVSRKKPVDHQRFFVQYRFAALQRHLELAGYRARDHEFKAVQFHIDRAKAYAQELGEQKFASILGDVSIAL